MLQKIIACLAFMLLALSAVAGEKGKGQEEGAGISAEHQNEQGEEHGNAYAGTKEDEEASDETEDEDEAADDDDGTKGKKEKGDKEDKEKKEKKAKKDKESKKEGKGKNK